MKTNKNSNIENWPIEKLIKYYYPVITQTIKSKAFFMKVEAEELQSLVNYRIGLAATNNSFTGKVEGEFLSWINTMIINAAIDTIRKRKKSAPYLVDIEQLEFDADQISTTKVYQTCNSHKKLLKEINCFIENRYRDKPTSFYIEIYNRILIDGEKIRVVAEDMKKTLNSISGAIRHIRAAIDKQFYSEYTELIND